MITVKRIKQIIREELLASLNEKHNNVLTYDEMLTLIQNTNVSKDRFAKLLSFLKKISS